MARSNDTDDKNESIQGLFDANPQMIGGYSVIAPEGSLSCSLRPHDFQTAARYEAFYAEQRA